MTEMPQPEQILPPGASFLLLHQSASVWSSAAPCWGHLPSPLPETQSGGWAEASLLCLHQDRAKSAAIPGLLRFSSLLLKIIKFYSENYFSKTSHLQQQSSNTSKLMTCSTKLQPSKMPPWIQWLILAKLELLKKSNTRNKFHFLVQSGSWPIHSDSIKGTEQLTMCKINKRL